MSDDEPLYYQSLWRGLVPVKPRMSAVAEKIAQEARVSVDDLRGPSRRREVAWPRQKAFALIYAQGYHSMPQIGRYFGGRDHTTVLHGLRAHAARQAEAR